MTLKSRRTFIFMMRRPILNGLRTIPLLQKEVREAGDFACFFDSPVGIDCITDPVIIMHLPWKPSEEENKILKSKFVDPRFFAISENFDTTRGLTCLEGFKFRLIMTEFGIEKDHSIFFHSLNVLKNMQQYVPSADRRKIVILAPYKDAPFFRSERNIKGMRNYFPAFPYPHDIFWFNDPKDFISDDLTYVVTIQTPGCAADFPAIYEYQEKHGNDQSVICVDHKTRYEEIGNRLAQIMR